jgi:mannosyltransferase OCH1-like enzyme
MLWPFKIRCASTERRIPRLVHVTARQPIDPRIAANLAQLKRKNPRYVVRCYNDEEISCYVERVWGSEMWSVFDSINPEYIVAKADLWRYLMIYDQGGVYLDDKSGPRISLDRIIRDDDELILSTWNMNCHLWAESHGHRDGEFLQWCIIARPRHPFMRAVICEVVLRIITATEEQRGKTGVITITGPLAFTDAILGAMSNGSAKYRIMQNSFRRKIFFNAITRDARLTKHHHAMRLSKRNYRSLTSPVINPEAVRRFQTELGKSSKRDFVLRLMSEFDARHPCATEGERL